MRKASLLQWATAFQHATYKHPHHPAFLRGGQEGGCGVLEGQGASSQHQETIEHVWRYPAQDFGICIVTFYFGIHISKIMKACSSYSVLYLLLIELVSLQTSV
jgi:hypothetical protein